MEKVWVCWTAKELCRDCVVETVPLLHPYPVES
jgi:hypothetical protein